MAHATFDVIVVGAGTMGAATCYELARRGVRVLGLERFDIPHSRGAHHGFSRLIRLAYFEHPDYVTLLARAYDNWERLERDTGEPTVFLTGGLYLGREDSELVAGSLRAARAYDLPHEMLDHAAVRQRFGQFHVPADMVGFFEMKAGFVSPARAMRGYVDQALRHGAELHGHEPVIDWDAKPSRVTVRTHRGTYEAGHVVFCGGAWTDQLVRDLGVPLTVTRQVLGWVWPRQPDAFALGRFPVWALDANPAGAFRGIHYGFPMVKQEPGLKIALHYPAETTDPDAVRRDVQPGDEATFRPMLASLLPEGDGPLLAVRTCLYTNSPDGHFIIDRHPAYGNVTVACGFSGHGFKFASVVGEVLADLAADGATTLPIGFLGLDRFGGAGA